MARALSFLLTVGLGASLAIVGQRLGSGPATAPRPSVPMTITPVPPEPTIEIQDIAIASPPVSPKGGVTAVVMGNRGMIQTCAQRSLPRDLGVDGVKLTLRLVVGISGRVKHVFRPGRDPGFRAIDPCIREAVSRWQLPQENEEYWVELTFALRAGLADRE